MKGATPALEELAKVSLKYAAAMEEATKMAAQFVDALGKVNCCGVVYCALEKYVATRK